MSLIIASVHGEVPEQIQGADLLEIRIDSMERDDAIEQLPKLLAKSPIPTVVTCRSVKEGGMFDGDEEDRVAMYRAALDCDNPPRYIDVEHKALTRHPLLLDALTSDKTGVILSWHDTTGRPRNLLQHAAEMQDVAGINIVKMVWRARSLRDNLEAFSLLKSRQQPMIAICMGEFGLMSRILTPKFGGFAVFASIEGKEATAQGQPTTSNLRSLYHFDEINSDTKVYGVIGNNVENSASPAFHNAAFEAAGENSVYIPLPIPSGWEHLKATVLELLNYPELNLLGASVTIPHKENMLKLVDSEDENCTKSGATNTVTFKDGKIYGNNTDIEAIKTIAQNAKRVLVLGGGGVARAAVIAANSIGARVFVATRRQEQALSLAQELPCELVADNLESIDTLINCTPVGMEGGNKPNGDPALALVPSLELAPPLIVIDTIYKPKDTPLIKRAKDAGCVTFTGDKMFRLQAVEQQKIWESAAQSN
ncbi:MAG: type I 3-dehydroquinate dehydratase [Phycisphaerales bacterium]|jgi:3-dehydroquinate dehydratase/shikimate dehydrogenase|nr:type I 3-dehydroquinate dehydratase [Phycisphaerales bacterium]